MLDLEVAKGLIKGHRPLNKSGVAVAGIQTTATDVWDRADATPTQQIWLAPTAARIHTIASTSVNDTTGGTGANKVGIFYLPDWNTKEQYEEVTGDLNAGIAMNNAAVMIHRMYVIPQSTSTTANAGTITATAATDSTVTAQINIGFGQTQMAIYGIPATDTLYLHDWYASIQKRKEGSCNFQLLFNPSPDVNTTVFLSRETRGLSSVGTSSDTWEYNPFKKFTGPGILKVQGIASAADMDANAGFNGHLVDNNYVPGFALTLALHR